MRHHIKA
nr:unnamed protein product [Callosobruchus analis]